MKTCFKCLETKPMDQFYAHDRMHDGHLGQCKVCACRYARLHRQTSDAPREGDMRRYAYNSSRRAKILSAAMLRIKANPEKRSCHDRLRYAVRTGRMTRPDSCPRCDSTTRIVGHHEDYSKPLDVLWMCSRCHSRLHWAKDNSLPSPVVEATAP